MTLDSKIPAGPIEKKWETHRFNMKIVNPANKRKYHIIVVGTGLAGASAAASPSVTLAINPPTTMTAVGQNFDVAIVVQAGTQQIDGAAASIDFDPATVQVVSVTTGSASLKTSVTAKDSSTR